MSDYATWSIYTISLNQLTHTHERTQARMRAHTHTYIFNYSTGFINSLSFNRLTLREILYPPLQVWWLAKADLSWLPWLMWLSGAPAHPARSLSYIRSCQPWIFLATSKCYLSNASLVLTTPPSFFFIVPGLSQQAFSWTNKMMRTYGNTLDLCLFFFFL